MEQLSADEKATVSTTIEGNAATVRHTVKADGERDTPRFNLTWLLDFSNCTEEQILDWAATSVRIALQGRWRKAPDRMDEEKWDNVTFDVAAVMAERSTADPATKARNAIAKLSPEQKAALLAELEAQNIEVIEK